MSGRDGNKIASAKGWGWEGGGGGGWLSMDMPMGTCPWLGVTVWKRMLWMTWTSEAATEAFRQTVGGGCQSGWGRLLSVINASKPAFAVRETVAGRRLGALEGGGGLPTWIWTGHGWGAYAWRGQGGERGGSPGGTNPAPLLLPSLVSGDAKPTPKPPPRRHTAHQGKVGALKKLVESVPDGSLIFFFDGLDVIFVHDIATILRASARFDLDRTVYISTERNCWDYPNMGPPPEREGGSRHYDKYPKSPTTWRYVNTGGVFAKVGANFRTFMRAWEACIHAGLPDQHCGHLFYTKDPRVCHGAPCTAAQGPTGHWRRD